MVRNFEKIQEAENLRRRGFTLEEIAKYCDISKSTASKWLKNKPFSDAVTIQNKRRVGAENAERLRLIAKARASERKNRYKDAENAARTEFRNYQSNPAFIAGLMVYVSAGDKKDLRTIRLSHVDVKLHRMFIRFSEQFLGVSRESIHLWLQLYAGISEESAMKYWSKQTKVPYSQFYKNQYVHTQAKDPLHFGVGNTIIASTYHKQKLLAWVQLAQKTW